MYSSPAAAHPELRAAVRDFADSVVKPLAPRTDREHRFPEEGISAQALGIAVAAFGDALTFSRERRQFGRPVAEFQGLTFLLADMATRIEAARNLIYHAAALCAAGRPFTREASMAKLFTTDTAMAIATDAIQVAGGYGYIQDYPFERYFRDAKACQIYEGTNQIQRVVIARALL